MTTYLFDTTYILPFFGVEITISHIKEELERILVSKKQTILLSTCSLIEAKWKALHNFSKTRNQTYLTRANIALESFKTSQYFTLIDSWYLKDACNAADELYTHGHSDYMDCWIAGTAKVKEAIFITEDNPLKDAINQLPEWQNLSVLSWETFLSEA